LLAPSRKVHHYQEKLVHSTRCVISNDAVAVSGANRVDARQELFILLSCGRLRFCMNIQPGHFLVQRREAEGKHLVFDLPAIEPECAADRRVINVDQLSVKPQISRAPGIVISTHNELLRVMGFVRLQIYFLNDPAG
jgi:hypothetical protein